MDYSRWAEMQYHKPLNPNPSSVDPYSHLYDADHSSSCAHYPYNTLKLPGLQTLLNHQEISSAQYKVGPEPGLGPPGIDSYAVINSYPPPPPTHVSYGAQAAITYGQHEAQISASTAAAYYPETGAAVQNWAAKEAIRQFGGDPVNWAAAGLRPLNGTKPFRAANHNPLGWSKPKTFPSMNGAWKKGTKKTKIVRSAWCEICRIDCNSKDVLDQHKM
ncbi:hypothetical protein NE237_014338 [Protea cynaroides]|uniref:C2H2-type domain-containing protein n=1 Tax=Protea cynaroides TaxID=273540 RepID=A0A9Q0KBX1_9MAGN|nr:hypothetical protein NE237_014338 [Protea cynaroides]